MAVSVSLLGPSPVCRGTFALHLEIFVGYAKNSLMLALTLGLENPQVLHPSPIAGKGMRQSGQLR